MSQLLISLSPDLKKLRDEGYEVEILNGHLVLHHVPYVTSRSEIAYGKLAAPLTMAGDIAGPPDNHIVKFQGEAPCSKNGAVLQQIIHTEGREQISPNFWTDRTFSNKPQGLSNFTNFYDKMVHYVTHLSGPAEALDPTVTAKTYVVVPDESEESVFHYMDTASSRAGTTALTNAFKGLKIAIVGLGGTGSYLLDLVAKTPVQEIHLFDGDRLLSHNAFRAPGAASLETLRSMPFKVDYYATLYAAQRKGIIPHVCYLQESNVQLLLGMDYVFICIDLPSAKKVVVEYLESQEAPFIDCGMGVQLSDAALVGVIRVTTSTKDKRDHVRSKNRISLGAEADPNEYDSNIQIAELNSLNAALAVIKWKKLVGFYVDLEGEHNAMYTLDGNHMLNEDVA